MSKTKLEILNEILEHYIGHPERFSYFKNIDHTISCQYRGGPNSDKRCAFSRCCTEEGVINLRERCMADKQDNPVDYYLADEYKGHPSKFWVALQSLHDDESCWTNLAELTAWGDHVIETFIAPLCN